MRLPGSATILFLIILLLLGLFSGKIKYYKFTSPNSSNVQGVTTEDIEADRVDEIVDGDTFTLGNGEKVRLIGINAPESGQPYYNDAKLHLKSLLNSKSIKLITDTQVQDQYGRILAYVYTDANLDVNLDMIKNGFAIVETVPPNVSRADMFTNAQIEARNNCLGIWEGLCGDTNLCIQISEINATSKDNAKNGEWVEFSNTCASSVDLSGYLLKDNSASNSYIFDHVVLKPKSSLKLYTGCGVDSNKAIYWTCPEQNNFIWNDTGDRAYLYDSSGKLISELGY